MITMPEMTRTYELGVLFDPSLDALQSDAQPPQSPSFLVGGLLTIATLTIIGVVVFVDFVVVDYAARWAVHIGGRVVCHVGWSFWVVWLLQCCDIAK